MIVVDTSVLVDFLKGRNTASARRLERLEFEGTPFALPAICCQELLQGAKDDREWSLILENLGTQKLLFPQDPWFTHVAAARIFFDCRRKGVTVRSSVDCYIAQLVLENDGILLHDDDDFDRIRKIRPLRTLRK